MAWKSFRDRVTHGVITAVCAVVAAYVAPAADVSEPPTLAAESDIGGALGWFQRSVDVGMPKRAGSTTYDAEAQEYRLSGGGRSLWGTRDEFHLAMRQIRGDFILQAHVRLLDKGTDPHRKAGWMVRKGLEADAAHVDGVVRGDGLTSLQYRRERGGPTHESQLSIDGADVLQMERRGHRYIFSAARFGEPWTSREVEAALGDDVYVGLVVCAHHADAIEQAVFHNVRILRPAREGFVPFRDFLGSHVELLEVQSGRRELVRSSPQPVEVPGWTKDGRALIYNSVGAQDVRGRLYRLDLASGEQVAIDTGSVTGITNHVLAPNGTVVAVTEYSTGEAAISTLPVQGGAGRRITTVSPSYLHGWSPDEKFVVYTGRRGSEFDIYKIPADGSGPEIRLTHSPGMDDGADYTPDGTFIYFNSLRSGRMQIWRMRPDGSDQEQVTNDEYNNWWPHPSPDGRWLVMLSYGANVASGAHPYYRHVYLRLMPLAGGAPTVIAYLYGGQGSINVPSWSPDSRRLAFMSNSGPLSP